MGMTIDEIIQSIQIIKAQAEWDYPLDWQIVLDGAIDTMRKYQQLQADYEARLKADMVAMLEDLRLDFQEAELVGVLDNKDLIFADEADDLIQQKINALRGENETC